MVIEGGVVGSDDDDEYIGQLDIVPGRSSSYCTVMGENNEEPDEACAATGGAITAGPLERQMRLVMVRMQCYWIEPPFQVHVLI